MENIRSVPGLVLLAILTCCLVLTPGQDARSQGVVLPATQVPLAGKTIPKFVDPLPTFVGARVDGTRPLTITMRERQQQVLPAALYPPAFSAGTYVWAYEVAVSNPDLTTSTYGPLYPAYTIEAQRGIPTNVTYVNELRQAPGVPAALQQYLKVDQTLHWAAPTGMDMMNMNPYAGAVPAVVHLHGGEVPSQYDGGPDSWFTPDKEHTGTAWGAGVSDVYAYPNTQEAATIWFHDHTLGATRINVYAGLAGFYFLRDAWDDGVARSGGLPAGPYEIEVAIQDRMFDTNGQLYFPSLGVNPMTHPFWIPEFFGDVIVVNGKTWPFFNVEPRRYRLRLLNGSNARFYNLAVSSGGKNGPTIWQIGTDGGLLNNPVAIAQPQRLLIAPGERADVIIDFSAYAGKTLTMVNDAKAPFPNGTPADPATVGQILQFRVAPTVTGGPDVSLNPATAGVAVRPTPLVPLVNFATATPAVPVDATRQLTLNEVMGMGGPLEVLVNNSKWAAATTELPQEGNTEVWKIVNLTADAHPIHLHLVQFQLISRQKIQTNKYLAAYGAAFPGGVSPVDGLTYPPGQYIPGFGPPLAYTGGVAGLLGGNPDVTRFVQGAPRPALPNERGWKDTFVMYPGEVTTVIVRFAPTDLAATTPKASLTFPFDPSSGPGYVWHCHIVDHEDNEMMRPYAVVPNPSRSGGVPVASTASTADANDRESALGAEQPLAFGLEQNYPNPFNPATMVRYTIEKDAHATLVLYNGLGEEVRRLVDGPTPAGQYTARIDGDRLASGVYFLRLNAGGKVATRKLTLLR